MEIVNTLDIDGYRWEITDSQARKDISGLKTDVKIVSVGMMDLTLKPGYTASFAKLQRVVQMGKLMMGVIHIIGLKGPDIGKVKSLEVAEFPFAPLELFEVAAVDTWQNNSFRVSVDTARTVYIMSTEKLLPGVSDIIGSFVCIKA